MLEIDDFFPIGAVAALGGELSGASAQHWLRCDGGEYPTADAPALFAAIGYIYGGSGANFKVPDYRGYFLRGASLDTNRDPDAATRTLIGTGTTPPGVGTSQEFATALPTNTAKDPFAAFIPKLPPGTVKTHGETWHEAIKESGNNVINTCTEGGDADTRPANVAVLFYIRAR